MSNPFAAPDEISGFDPTGSGEFRRISARPIERLTEAKAMLGDQYWLFVGICLVGILIGSMVPMGIMMGPMMCGIYLCFRYRMNGIQVRFETLFKGFDVFVNSLLAMLILMAISMVVIFPLMIFMMIMMATAGNNEAQAIATVVTMYPLIIVASLLVSIPFLFVFPLIVDRGAGPWEAVTLSARRMAQLRTIVRNVDRASIAGDAGVVCLLRRCPPAHAFAVGSIVHRLS